MTSSNAPAPCPPCLLVNPRSFRASRQGMAGRAMRLVREAGLEAHTVTDPPTLFARLDVLRAQGVSEIWMLSGDGILQALAGYLAETAPEWSPSFVLLGGGRANVVPRDVGGYPALRALRRVLSARREGRALPEEHITILRIAQAAEPARYGYVWAGALVHEAVRLTAANRAAGRGWWRHSWFSDPYVLLRWAVQTMVLRQPLPDTGPVTVRAAGLGELSGRMRALVASTLAMRDALYNPFAQRGQGAVRFTAISDQATGLWGRMPRILRGDFDDTMNIAGGILSGRTESVELSGVSGYALDGELFTADPARPLHLGAARTLRVLRPVP